jgi:Leucine-rich repeat (LRR) protein
MKKEILFVLVFVCTNLSMAQSKTSIPDAQFERYLVNNNIDSDGLINGEVLNSDIAGVTQIDVHQLGINDLTGIEGFSSLTFLSAWGNNLTSINVSSNLNLEYLSLTYNKLTTIDISNNTKLTDFGISDNLLTTLDVSENSELTSLSLALNNISNLDLTNNTKLITLNCVENKITDLDISNLLDLETLSITENNISYLNVSNCLQLKDLIAGENEIVSIDLSKNINLEEVKLNDNKLISLNVKNGNNTSIIGFDSSRNFDLKCIQVDNENYSNNNNKWYKHTTSTFLESCSGTLIPDANFELYLEFLGLGNSINNDGYVDTGKIALLETLDISDENISDLTGIEYFISLKTLDASVNTITTLDLTKNINLESLNLAQNPTKTIDLSQNTKLTTLNVSGNQLTSLDLSKNSLLEVLDVKLNQLTSLDLNNNLKLKELNMSSNTISDIDLSMLADLEFLYGFNSGLNTINISKNDKLNFADLSSNQLEYIDLYGNVSLTRLKLEYNQLKYLDIQNNPNIVELNASFNQLTALNLKNTKNNILFNINISNNSNLLCAEVDDVSFSNTYWSNKDAQTVFSLDCAPANDDCTNAIPLTFGQQTPGDVNTGSISNNPPCETGNVLADVWFSVIVPKSGEFSVEGSVFRGSIKFAVYENCGLTNTLACGKSVSLKNLTIGSKLYLKVWLESVSSKSNFQNDNDGSFTLTASDSSVLSLDNLNEENRSLTVFPNPAETDLTISSLGNIDIQNIALYGVLGKKVISKKNNKASKITLDVSNLPVGIYFIRAQTTKGILTKKLIIK